jgi:hypothetical protein
VAALDGTVGQDAPVRHHGRGEPAKAARAVQEAEYLMEQVPLTPRLLAKLVAMFPAEDRSFAEQWLLSECGPEIPGGFTDAGWVERVRAAALKISRGSLDKLADATRLGQADWRDLLIGAGFGESVSAYEVWLNEPNSN